MNNLKKQQITGINKKIPLEALKKLNHPMNLIRVEPDKIEALFSDFKEDGYDSRQTGTTINIRYLGGKKQISQEKAEAYLTEKGMMDRVIRLEESTATVTQAADALGVEPGMIAKTMSFLQNDQPILILTEGTARIDNRKYKDTFHIKAKMIPFDEVEQWIGHAPGGVCPFGIKEGGEKYIWMKVSGSLRRFIRQLEMTIVQ